MFYLLVILLYFRTIPIDIIDKVPGMSRGPSHRQKPLGPRAWPCGSLYLVSLPHTHHSMKGPL